MTLADNSFMTDPGGLNLRDYQIKAINKATEAVLEGKRTALLAMATGTGKTRTALGLIYKMLEAKRFHAISDCSLDLRQKSIEWFVQRNRSPEAFKNLSLSPRIISAVGSFVPVHKKQIDFLTSLLPLFQGIDFIDHKKYINDRIEGIRLTIKQEEISDILTG